MSRAQSNRRRYRRFLVTFAAVVGVVVMFGTCLIGYWAVTGGQAAAQVVGVRHGKSTVYDVAFTTEDGRACNSVLTSTESPELPVGAVVTIRYDRPCLNVWYPNDYGRIIPSMIFSAFAASTWTGAYLAWFRTDPDGRIDWPHSLRWFSAEWWNDVPPRP